MNLFDFGDIRVWIFWAVVLLLLILLGLNPLIVLLGILIIWLLFGGALRA